VTADIAPWIHAGLWLFGCAFGVLIRAALWLAKQPPETATLSRWWREKYGANMLSLLIGVLGTGVWAEGSLLKWLQLDGVALTYGLSPIAGAIVTYGARWIVAWADKFSSSKTGAAPPDGD
jgi:hypothetical protein